MNYTEKWDYLFGKFADMFPEVAKMTVDGYVSGRYEITMILSDGGLAIYDGMSDRARFRKPSSMDISESDWREEFSRRLKKQMARVGLTQGGLAEAAGIGQKSISNYLNGKTVPDLYSTTLIAKALDCSITELCEF